eukprot:TRINITY_DN92345_c0_g1_i1.p1 TRINITY_DN92345_c0_g1~~TRINITY_DN92345_c0_g1_i1.p1  ORF type:complete len:129 (-),score=23.80 TRINITY_DN92345_c0_g1_i1:139-525(-)
MDSETLATAVGIVNAIGIILAGVYGFVKAKSKPSLIASGICGMLLLVFLVPGFTPWSWYGEIVLAVLMALMFYKKAFSNDAVPEKMVSLLGQEDAEKVSQTSKTMFKVLFFLCDLEAILCCYVINGLK